MTSDDRTFAAASTTTRSTVRRDDIRWTELLTFFRQVQSRHERSRRSSAGPQGLPFESERDSPAVASRTASGAQTFKRKVPVGGRKSDVAAPTRPIGSVSGRPSSPGATGILKKRLGSKP